jgi:hypothetical protein
MTLSDYTDAEGWKGIVLHLPKSRERDFFFPETGLLIHVLSYV